MQAVDEMNKETDMAFRIIFASCQKQATIRICIRTQIWNLPDRPDKCASRPLISKDFLAANGFALSVIAFLLWSRTHAWQRVAGVVPVIDGHLRVP